MALAVTLVDAILPNIYQFLSKWYLMGTSVALKLLPTAPSPLLHTHTHTVNKTWYPGRMEKESVGTKSAVPFFSIVRLPRPVRVWESCPPPWSAHTTSRPGHQAFYLPHGSAPSVYPLDTGSVCAVSGSHPEMRHDPSILPQGFVLYTPSEALPLLLP